MPNNLEIILFVLQQTKDLINYGVTPNIANRTLKTVLGQYWQYPMLGYSVTTTTGKMKLPRSVKAKDIQHKGDLVVEHAVPKQVIVNMLLAMKNPTRTKVRNLLRKYWRVVLITREEDERLNEKGAGLRYSMPDGWDKKDVWARYKAVGIRLTKNAINQGQGS